MENDELKKVMHKALRSLVEEIVAAEEHGTENFYVGENTLLHNDITDILEEVCDPSKDKLMNLNEGETENG